MDWYFTCLANICQHQRLTGLSIHVEAALGTAVDVLGVTVATVVDRFTALEELTEAREWSGSLIEVGEDLAIINVKTKFPTHIHSWHSGNLVYDVFVSIITSYAITWADNWGIPQISGSGTRGRMDQESESEWTYNQKIHGDQLELDWLQLDWKSYWLWMWKKSEKFNEIRKKLTSLNGSPIMIRIYCLRLTYWCFIYDVEN